MKTSLVLDTSRYTLSNFDFVALAAKEIYHEQSLYAKLYITLILIGFDYFYGAGSFYNSVEVVLV